MTYFRIYCFDRDQHIQAFTEANCATDAEAVAEARPLLARYARIEVWDRSRLVHRLDGEAVPAASIIASTRRRRMFASFLPYRGSAA